MAQLYVGLDVHSKYCIYVVSTEKGEILGEGDVPTTPEGLCRLRDTHHLPPQTPVALETGTTAFHVARHLVRLDLKPVVIDAHEVRLKAHRPFHKSDRRDAYELCVGLRNGIYRCVVHIPDERIGALRELLSRRRHFVRLRTAEVIAVKRLLRAQGLGHLARTLNSNAAWARLLVQLPIDGGLRTHAERHYIVWQCASQQLEALNRDLEVHQAPFHEDVRRLQAIPGVGPVVTLTALAAFSDITRFPTAKHAASYAGLVPSTRQSGDSDQHGHITKRGSGELRAMLCEAAQHARRPDHPLNPFFSKVCARRGYKSAVVAVAHRLCRIFYAMLRDRAEFDVSKFGVEKGRFLKRTVRLYRLKPVRVA